MIVFYKLICTAFLQHYTIKSVFDVNYCCLSALGWQFTLVDSINLTLHFLHLSRFSDFGKSAKNCYIIPLALCIHVS